jgi:hypothetical protein
MYSVIFTTMWRSEEIHHMLPRMNEHPLVDEIIIINNAVSCTPDWFLNGVFDKVKTFDMPHNTYVNPAWNMGVSIAHNDKICLYSDDVYFDTNVFYTLNDKLSIDDGCVGPGMIPPHNISAGIQIGYRPEHANMPLGYGTLLFFNKRNYVPIPKPLRIFFGDVWIYCQSVVHRKEPRWLYNFNIRTKLGTSSNTVSYGEVQNFDNSWWRNNMRGWNDILNYKES